MAYKVILATRRSRGATHYFTSSTCYLQLRVTVSLRTALLTLRTAYRCDAPLSWSHTEQRALVDEGERGKPASTRFTLLRLGRTTSLVQCEPITGRSHQIRAHLAILGHPVANDRTYLGDTPAAHGPDEPSANELRIFADDGARSHVTH